MKKFYVLIILSLMIIISCHDDDITQPHTLPERLVPADNAENVALDTSITVTFEEAMQCDGLAVALKDNDMDIPGRVTCSDDTLVFTPIWGLKYNKSYSVTVSNTGVTDTVGTQLDEPLSWTFSTPRVCWIATSSALVQLDSLGNELVRMDLPFGQSLDMYTQFALDPRDNAIWISDTSNDRLMKLSNEGQLLVYREQDTVEGTAVDPRDGTVFVFGSNPSDEWDRAFWALSSIGLPLKHSLYSGDSSPFVYYDTMTWLNTDNTLWMAGNYSGTKGQIDILRLNPDFPDDYDLNPYSNLDGDYHMLFGPFYGRSSEMSVFEGNPELGLDPYIAVAGAINNVVVLEVDGSERWRVASPDVTYIYNVTSDPHDGSLWAGGTGSPDRVVRYSADGSQLVAPVAIPGVINAIKADPLDGGVWIGTRTDDGSQGALIRLSATGEELWRYPIQGGINSIVFPSYSSLNRTLFVAETGSDQEGSGTTDQPLASIGEALNQAIDGDTIRVSAGTYQENITLKSGIRLIGEDAQTTTIQGLGTTHVVEGLAIERVWIEGVAITGAGENTSGMYFEECRDIIIQGNIIRDNGKDYDGVSYSYGIDMTLSDGLISQNIITGNRRRGISIITGDGGVIIRNNIITHNGDSGLLLDSGAATSIVLNNVIDSNGSDPWARPGVMVSGHTIIKNNIISNNGGPNPDQAPPVGIWVYGTLSTPELFYNNVYNNYAGGYTNSTAGTGDISADPLFEAQTYRLGAGSPAIDSGDPDLQDAGDCSRSDMGVYGGMFAMP